MAVILGRPDIEPFLRIKTITTNYTVVRGDAGYLILVNTTGGNVTVSLPALSTVGDGFVVTIKRITAGANTLTIDPNGAETIEGAATLSLPTQYQAVNLVSLAASGWLLGAAPLAIATAITAGSGLTGGGTLASGVTISGTAASTSVAGVVELADTTETQALSSTTLAVTPGGLATISAPLLLETLATTSGATITSGTLPACRAFLLLFNGVSGSATATISLAISDDDGGSFDTARQVSASNAASTLLAGPIWIYGTGSVGTKYMLSQIVSEAELTSIFCNVATWTTETGVTNKVRFTISAGAFDAGEILVFGSR